MIRVQARKALIVGINDYVHKPLSGCVNDAVEMEKTISTHEDGSPNFDSILLVSAPTNCISIQLLKTKIKELFSGENDMVLFYFSGHGFLDAVDGYIVGQDAESGDELPMEWIIKQAANSANREILLILDCCHAGALGNSQKDSKGREYAQLRKGITILAATSPNDVAREWKGRGVFNRILIDGLKGSATDIFGHVTAAGLYNHADSLLSSWQQRPVFKTNVTQMTPIRYCVPRLPQNVIRELTIHFPIAEGNFPLDPSYEETSGSPNPDKVFQFQKLRQMERAGLIECISEKAMYWEAMNNGGCRLTSYGKFIHELAKRKRI